jgi:hypothetical protein
VAHALPDRPQDNEFAAFPPTLAANAAAISGSGKKWRKWKEMAKMERNGEKWSEMAAGGKQRC